MLKKLPLLLLSPLTATLLAVGLYALFPNHGVFRYCAGSFAILLMCTLWVRWAWRTEFWRALSAVCMGGVFQVAVSCLSQILLLNSELQFTAVIYLVVVLISTFLLYRLRFGRWFHLLLEEGFGQRRTALFLFALEAAMEAFLILQVGVQRDYLVPYYVLVLAQGERLSLRVSNPYIGTVDPDKLWAEGFSTKGESRGLGLASFQRILAGYANAASSTSWAGGVFVQELTVEGRP